MRYVVGFFSSFFPEALRWSLSLGLSLGFTVYLAGCGSKNLSATRVASGVTILPADTPTAPTSNSNQVPTSSSTPDSGDLNPDLAPAAASADSPTSTITPLQRAKLVFDTSDTNAILNCGGFGILNNLHKRVVLSPDEATCTGLKLPDSDPMSIRQHVMTLPQSPTAAPSDGKALIPNSLYDFVLDDFYSQKVKGQGFWDISKTSSRALEFTHLTRQKAKDLEINPVLNYEFFTRVYDLQTDIEKVQLGSETLLKAKKRQKILRRLFFKMDIESAWWLRVKIDRLALCLEKAGYAAPDSSRDSLRTWVMFSVFSAQLKPELALVGGTRN